VFAAADLLLAVKVDKTCPLTGSPCSREGCELYHEPVGACCFRLLGNCLTVIAGSLVALAEKETPCRYCGRTPSP
jgi:hypothetical protein